MKTDVARLIFICLCVCVVSCSCFQKHIRSLTATVNELFAKKPCDDGGGGDTPRAWKTNRVEPVQCDGGDDDKFYYNMFGVDWRSLGVKVANNWWIIAVSTLLPLIVFVRVQYNMRQRLYKINMQMLRVLYPSYYSGKNRNKSNMNSHLQLHEWKKLLVQKEKTYTYSRRLTLPDLTLAKHVRRESLADSAQKMNCRPRKLSQCNIMQFRSMRKNSSERNDQDSSGDVKRAHIIRRRH